MKQLDFVALADLENAERRHSGYVQEWLDNPEFRAMLMRSARENRLRHQRRLAQLDKYGYSDE